MTNWWDASLKLQKQMLDAQKASLGAGQAAVSAGDQLVKLQQAAAKTAGANMAAWKAWAGMFGIK